MNMTLYMAASESSVPDPETVDTFAQMVNKYGFMVVFSVIILILIVVLFTVYVNRSGKKANSELDILEKERNATINQNEKMFDLVTNVQTQQIIQLQEMTDTLKDMNKSIQEDRLTLIETSEDFEKVKDSIMDCDENSKVILTTLSEILDYVKTSEKCNREILEKVNILEKSLITNNLDNHEKHD